MKILVILLTFLTIYAMDNRSVTYIEPPLSFVIQSHTRLYDRIRESHAEYLGTDTLLNIGELSLIHSIQIIQNQKTYLLILETSPDGTLLHAGLNLFKDRPFMVDEENQRFIERYFLELLLEDKPKQTLEHDRISLSYNGQSFGSILFKTIDLILPVMINADRFTLYKKDYQIIAEWVHENNVIWLSFPANLQLITGKDKRELDGELIIKLLDQTTDNITPSIPFPNNLTQDSTGMLIQTGPEFYPGISRHLYFILSEDDTIPVFDFLYTRESLINYLQYPGTFTGTYPIDLEIKTRNPLSVNISYDTLNMVLGEDYETFIGIEKENADGYEVVVLYKNIIYDHIHLCLLRIPFDFIEEPEQEWTGELYPYIRQDNLAKLFATLMPGTGSEPVQIKQE